MGPNERFEYMTELFYKQTGYMAPGKDSPAGFYTEEEKEKGQLEWNKWLEDFYSKLFLLHKSNSECIENSE